MGAENLNRQMHHRGFPAAMAGFKRPVAEESKRYRIRIRFRKVDDLRWIGHRDLVRTMERVFRRAGVPLVFSQGFHPKPRMTFPSPLPLGIAGWNEVAEVMVADEMDTTSLVSTLNCFTVPGLEFRQARLLAPREPKPRLKSCVYTCVVEGAIRQEVASRLQEIEASGRWPLAHGTPGNLLDLKEHLYSAEIGEDALRVSLRPSELGGPTIREVLTALGLGQYEREGGIIVRSDVILVDESVPPAKAGQEGACRQR